MHGNPTKSNDFRASFLFFTIFAFAEDKPILSIDFLNKLLSSAFLIDSGNSVQKGGTGIAFDWKLIPKTEKEKIIVAGGINSSNVSDLLSKKHNIFGIDVNSGLESKEAIKDIEKIETFFKVLKKNGK